MALSLLKLYHKDESASMDLYKALYRSPLSHHLNFYIQQINASRTFPAFYYYTDDMVQCLSLIMQNLRDLSTTTALLPGVAVHSFQRSCLIEEIMSSNEIEGVHSTRKEINAAIDEQNDIAASNKIRLWSTVNKYLKLQNKEEIPFQNSVDLRAFYDSFIADEISRDNPQNLPDGKIFRKSSVDVWSRTKIIHHGIFPEEQIINDMDIALAFLHDDHVPSLIRISIFHYLFGYIHPFYDGNGRTSRFITSYYLSRVLSPLVAFRLSITIKKSIRVYYKLFDDTNHQGNYGDLTPFITGFLWLIQKSVARVREILQEKASQLSYLQKELLERLPDLSNTDKKIYTVLLEAYLFSNDGASLEEISDAIGQSVKTIRSHIKSYPPKSVSVNKVHRAHRFKLSAEFIQSIQKHK